MLLGSAFRVLRRWTCRRAKKHAWNRHTWRGHGGAVVGELLSLRERRGYWVTGARWGYWVT